MQDLIHRKHHSPIITAISVIVGFLGLQAVSGAISEYQISSFLFISFAVYFFLVLLQTFVFDLHLKTGHTLTFITLEKSLLQALKKRFLYIINPRHWLHFQNYLLLPGILFWSTIALLYLNPFDALVKQLIITFSTIALGMSFWHLGTYFYHHNEISKHARQSLFVTKLYASYIAYAGAFGISRYFAPIPNQQEEYFALGASGFAVLVFCVTFLLMHQAFFQHRYTGFKTLRALIIIPFGMSALAHAVYFFWNVNYFSGAVVLAAFYQTAWAFLHHGIIDKDLTREIVYEYLSVLLLILVIIISTTNFAERI